MEKYGLGSIGKPGIVLQIVWDRNKKQHLTEHPAHKCSGEQMRATACVVACSPPTASIFFWRRRLGSYHSQLLLSGRKKPLNATHGWATAMQLSEWFYSVFWVDRLFLVALGRSSWWKICACDCHDYFLKTHRRSTLCNGRYPWPRLLPRSPPVAVHDLSPRLGSSIVPKERWIASGMLTQWEHAVQVG